MVKCGRFRDSCNLGWKLAAVLQGWGGDGLLDSYDAERRPVFASTARDFIERYIEDDRAFLAAHDPVRDKDDFEKAWFSRNLDADEVLAFEPNYEGSPIIPQSKGMPSARGSHSFAARPGHLLPPPGPDGRETGNAIGPEFTVLAARPERAAGFTKAAKSLGVPLSAPASMADWHQCWGREVILVRPDRYVAWTGDNDADADRILRAALGS